MTANAPWIVLAMVIFIFLMRWNRVSGREFLNINESFLRFKKGGFDGSKVEVLFSDMRVDRFAKGSFYEMSVPKAAVYVCRNKDQQHYLWTRYEPTLEKPVLKKLSVDEAAALLKRSKTLLAELCPRQK